MFLLSENELKNRQEEEESKGDRAYKPESRDREISASLKSLCSNL